MREAPVTITCTSHPRGNEIATTIKRQIGLDAWLAVSARNPRWWTNETGDVVFAFRFGSRYGLPKWCEITYQSVSDDYDLWAYKIHRNGCRRAPSPRSSAMNRCGWPTPPTARSRSAAAAPSPGHHRFLGRDRRIVNPCDDRS